MPTRRSALLLLALIFGLIACGGPTTRLVTVRAKGEGKIEFAVKNLTDVPLNTFFLA